MWKRPLWLCLILLPKAFQVLGIIPGLEQWTFTIPGLTNKGDFQAEREMWTVKGSCGGADSRKEGQNFGKAF